MIRADLLIASPIYLVGLAQILTEGGMKVVAKRATPDEDPAWISDAMLIDENSLVPSHGLDYVAGAAQWTQVLVLANEPAASAEKYLRAGAAGVIGQNTSTKCLLSRVHQVSAGQVLADAAEDGAEECEQSWLASLHLSRREGEVLRQISLGLTHGQIATRLGISPHTVDTYVKRIRSKVGAGNKAELTRFALMSQAVRGWHRFDLAVPGAQAGGG